jgi:hypothetical protein
MLLRVRVIRHHPARVKRGHPHARNRCRHVQDATYEIRIKGRVSRALLASFEGMESELEPVETVIHGPVRDQAELHGLIDRIQALGLELIELRRLPK